MRGTFNRLVPSVRCCGRTWWKTEVRQQFHQGAAERAIDNVEGRNRGEVNQQQGRVAQESVGKCDTTCILGRIASTHELDTLEANPGVVAGSPEST